MTPPEMLSIAQNLSLPLPLYQTMQIGRMTGRDGTRFDIIVGLDRALTEQLKEKSLDESDVDIQKNTSDRERFGKGSYTDWYSKGRTPFALVEAGNRSLAALVWFGPKPLGRKSLSHLSEMEKLQDETKMDAGNWHTLVYRSYPPFRGTGIMKAFTRSCIGAYRHAFPQAKFWVGIHTENPASVGLAQSLGLVVDTARSDPAQHHTVMVESA